MWAKKCSICQFGYISESLNIGHLHDAARPTNIPMLVWLFVLPYLAAASLLAEAPKLALEMALPKDVLTTILLKIGFADLYQASYVSKGCRSLVDQFIRSFYGFQYGGKTFLNYTRILRDLDVLVQGIGKNAGIAEATGILNASAHFTCIRSMLEVRFGYCIRCDEDCLPTFYLPHCSLGILNVQSAVSVLPYLLDHAMGHHLWVGLLRGLVELERSDLLHQLTLAKIDEGCLRKLMSVSLPESVLLAAVGSLQRNEPASELSRLLALAESEDQAAAFPGECRMPLFVLHYLHMRGARIPERCIFINGSQESSVGFWMHLISTESRRRELVDMVLRHGDDDSKLLASVWHGAVSYQSLSAENADIFQAMLIRFRFSVVCNEHVIGNYNGMLAEHPKFRYHSTCALMDCGQFQLLGQCDYVRCGVVNRGALADRAYRLKHGDSNPFVREFIKICWGCPSFLKQLIQSNADSWSVQLVWEALNEPQLHRCIMNDCCSPPLDVLQRLVSEQDASADSIQRMLDVHDGFQMSKVKISKETSMLYTVMFWEASESIISHFLNMVPEEFELDDFLVRGLLRLPKYSRGLCARLIQRSEVFDPSDWYTICKLRPDLLKEFNLRLEVAKVV